MSSHSVKSQQGFSMVELLISTLVIGLMSGTFFIFFSTAFDDFFRIQQSSIITNDKTVVLYRMAQVIRSGTTIGEASPSSLTIYAYFSPQDSVLSQVRYVYNSSDKTIKVERIKATGTAPNYLYPAANKESRILLNQTQLTGDLFSYKDANGTNGPFTTDTFKDIKTISIDLNTAKNFKTSDASQMKTTVELRNRKTNL